MQATILLAEIDWEEVGTRAAQVIVIAALVCGVGSIAFVGVTSIYFELKESGWNGVVAAITMALVSLAVVGGIYFATTIDWSTADPELTSTTTSTTGGGSGHRGSSLSVEDVYGDEVVREYCSGAVSTAQYYGCVEHVTFDDVLDTDTPAARDALSLIPSDAWETIDSYGGDYPP